MREIREYFFYNDTATTEIYTLSLHDALPISGLQERAPEGRDPLAEGISATLESIRRQIEEGSGKVDRKSTRLNSSHANISYAVFCLKKKQHQTSYPKPRSSPALTPYNFVYLD